jgi:hypothetical protein
MKMNLIVRLYEIVTAISHWSENLRVALLLRAFGVTNDCKPPIPWRKREGLPSLDQWPKAKDKDGGVAHSVWVIGKVKAGPVRPVPAKLESNLDTYVKVEAPKTAEEALARLRARLEKEPKV